MENNKIKILDLETLKKYPKVLEILLIDHTTKKNIIWATNNYKALGETYIYSNEILVDAITGENAQLITPRVKKNKLIQQTRLRDMAEVYTPSWLCNAQNNLIDNSWFGREHVFNKELIKANGERTWEVIEERIDFTNEKNWKLYIRANRLEVTCGEAPYIVSRHDTTTGEFIPIQRRIGILDRKLRVINENVNDSSEWLEAAQDAFKSTYAFEWQGDSLLLAREAMLITFIENYFLKFGKEPLLRSIQYIAYIISWNVWQMDGLKGVIPNSCGIRTKSQNTLLGELITSSSCEGCLKDNILKHNGIYAIIKDWSSRDLITGKKGKNIKYIETLKTNKK